MRAATLLAAALLATGPALTGCSGSDEPRGATATPSASASQQSSATPPVTPPATPPATPAPGRFPTYVALGDSYTAAPLAGPTDRTGGCLRSTVNYPSRVAEALGARLTDVSCTGADTAALIGAQRTTAGVVPPQFEALQPGTSLVTVGIGGNDFQLFSTLVGACVEAGRRDPEGAPCRDELGREGVAELRREVRTVGERLAAVVEGIRGRSPGAEVVVVGYPEIVPADATCPERLPIAAGDHAFAAGLNELLTRVQGRAAREAGALYVDVYAASDGHDVCSDDPWVNGRVTSAETALAFHPLVAGQEAVASLVLDALVAAEPST